MPKKRRKPPAAQQRSTRRTGRILSKMSRRKRGEPLTKSVMDGRLLPPESEV